MTRLDQRRATLVARALAAVVLLPPGLAGQYDEPPPPAAYALEDVTVVHPDGRRQEGVNVVVRGASIASLAPGAEIPTEARRLEGDSLHVYPGLVDGWGSVPVGFPEGPDRDEVVPWDPSRAAQGFTPHRRVVDHLTATGATTAGPRRAGVVAMGVVPLDGVAPGRGAVVLLRPGAETPRELVARPELALGMSFRGSGSAYPSTLFGVIALVRQAFLDAGRLQGLQEARRTGAGGPTVPPWDPDYEVLRRAAVRDLPVFFRAEEAGDIRRVLALADEVGLSPVIVGGGESWRLAGELARREVPVLVSLDFPEPEEWEPDGEPPDTAGTELAPGAAREKERLENLYANPSRLVEAGVRVALTSGGGRADLREGARTAIEHGLSETAALRALTSTPASILGISDQASLRVGGPANLVITSGPLFGEGSPVRYTLVEGELEEGDGAAEGGEQPAVDVTGSWRLELTGDGGAMVLRMALEQSGASVTGTVHTAQGLAGGVRNGSVSGALLRFSVVFDVGGDGSESRLTGSVEGDTISGRGTGIIGDFRFTAIRTPQATEGKG